MELLEFVQIVTGAVTATSILALYAFYFIGLNKIIHTKQAPIQKSKKAIEGHSTEKKIKGSISEQTRKKHQVIEREARIQSRQNTDISPTGNNSNSDRAICSKLKKTGDDSNEISTTVKTKDTVPLHLCNITWELKNGYYYFVLEECGGILDLPFCNILFPFGVTLNKIELCFKSVVSKKRKHGKYKTLITPIIHCSSSNNSDVVNFLCPIEIKVKMLCYPPSNQVQKVELQTTHDSIDLKWSTVDKLKVSQKQDYISFKLKKFAGFRVICRNAPSFIPAYDLFHTVYVKRPIGLNDPIEQNFFVLLHSSHRDVRKEANASLDSSAIEIVVGKQILPIRPPCTFSAKLQCEGMNSMSPVIEHKIGSSREKVLVHLPISIKKESIESIPPHHYKNLHYSVWSEHQNSPICYRFQWSLPAPDNLYDPYVKPSTTINANGERSIGQQMNYCNSCPNCSLKSNFFDNMFPDLPHTRSEENIKRREPLTSDNAGTNTLSNSTSPLQPFPQLDMQLPSTSTPRPNFLALEHINQFLNKPLLDSSDMDSGLSFTASTPVDDLSDVL
uniref:uncharacterized protein LOC120348436 isoform X1 n=1 Tax=Styela clava TaxID=7725 RepID=UPI00193A179E|nr:uncharacterized protein LOC120348436 isoform X1 [Styela clava]